jgi:preprotein translocase subunit SecF
MSMRFFANANYDFIGRRRTAYMISAAALAVALLAALAWEVTRDSWLNYGVDFTGGTIVQVQFEEPTSVGDLRSAVPGATITRFGSDRDFLVRAAEFGEGERSISEQLSSQLAAQYGAGTFEVVRTEAVGPTIGAELRQRASIAIMLSFLLTLIYIAFRFEWRFGVAAIIATLHDILIAVGFISLFRLEVSLPTVAAVLTIIGYSLNDTIIVFDRVRENLKVMGRRISPKEIINKSINDVLPRTVMTSGTTLAALFALFLLGGPIIRDFALILILGIIVGTYSSIFVASPALLEIERRWGPKDTSKPTARLARQSVGSAVD